MFPADGPVFISSWKRSPQLLQQTGASRFTATRASYKGKMAFILIAVFTLFLFSITLTSL
jgi:hypothetical protein